MEREWNMRKPFHHGIIFRNLLKDDRLFTPHFAVREVSNGERIARAPRRCRECSGAEEGNLSLQALGRNVQGARERTS